MSDVLISVTYSVWDEAALEAGDTDDKGFEAEDVPHTWREAIEAIRDGGYTNPSSSNAGDWGIWLTDNGMSDINGDLYTGERTERSIHFARPDGTPLKANQVRRLFRAAGVTIH